MRTVYAILSLLILLFVIAFAAMNSELVTVNFIGLTKWQTPVAVLILVCFTSGIILMGAIHLFGRLRTWKSTKELKIYLKAAEEERDLLRRRVEELTRTEKKA